jgi:hypothetical protein
MQTSGDELAFVWFIVCELSFSLFMSFMVCITEFGVITKKKIIDISSNMYNNKYMYNIKEGLK